MEYQELLKTRYMSLELISPLEMLDCFSTQYINLTLIREEKDNDPSGMFQQDKRCDSITVADALDVEGYHKKVLLILGGPGMGKSTFAINVCKQWAGGALLQNYDAVVLLVLRDPKIQGAKTIKDLLRIDDDDLRENVCKEIIKSNGEKVCFVFDGYDELPYDLQINSVFAEFIDKFPKCTLVYTTRPEAYYQTPYKGSKIIRINGFNEKSVDKYITEAFEKHENGEEMAFKLKAQVQNNPVIRSILNIPINVAIMCLIFFHYSTLPKTLTELYTKLCLRLILRHIITRTPNERQIQKLQSLSDLPTDVSEQFAQLCYVAYVGMENEKIIFSSQDLDEFGVAEDNLHCMGLLLIAPTTSVAGREKSYNFLHLTLQEYCAAWYISKLSAEDQVECMSTFHYQEKFNMVWRFYSGITKLQNKELLEYILPCKVVKFPISPWKASKLINIAYEAHSSEVCQILGECFKNESLVIILDSPFFESHAINYVLTQYKGLLRVSKNICFEVLIDWSPQRDIDVNHLFEDIDVKYLNSVYELSVNNKDTKSISQMLFNSRTLKSLKIYKTCECNNDFTYLANCKNIFLQKLRLCGSGLDLSELDVIGEMLSHNTSIKSLNLRGNNITDEGIEKLVHHLMNNNTLQQIDLSYNKITADGVTHLSKLITREHLALTSIELYENPLKDKGVNMLLQSLSLGIEHIGLYDVQMTSLSSQSLGDALHKVKSISFNQLPDIKVVCAITNQQIHLTDEYLEMFNTHMKSISTNYWEVITTSLVNTTVLEHLDVILNDVPTSKLINGIAQNKSIKTLKLFYRMDNENISYTRSNWAVELAQYIQYNTSLKHLTVSGWIVEDSAIQFLQLLTESLTINTSIKSVIYELNPTSLLRSREEWESDVFKAIDKLKENNTLEELKLSSAYVDEEEDKILFSKIEHCIQQINKTRNIKGITNLKVNIVLT